MRALEAAWVRSLSDWSKLQELVPRHRYTFEDYLELEEIASVRHEFYDGEIYAMAGGTPEHAARTAAITSALGAQIEGSDCRLYTFGEGKTVPLEAVSATLNVDSVYAAARSA